jgi:hypothetical protein
MDDRRFDTLTRAIGRRGVLAGALGLAAGGPAVADPLLAGKSPAACPKRGTGVRCRQHGQCCSGRCLRKKGKRRGRCRCSRLLQPCAVNADCCGHREGIPGTPICQDHPDGFRCELLV